MFSNSEIAKSFSCGRTKCAALVTNALAPHFRKKLVDDMSLYPFSIMIDESNASTDKSCIILVRKVVTSVLGFLICQWSILVQQKTFMRL